MSYSDNVAFSYCPDYSQKLTVDISQSENKFGDGYIQFVGDGVNKKVRKYSLQFSKSPTECDAIESTILSTKMVGKILWTPQNNVAGKWIYKDLKRSISDFGMHTITVTFEEVFEP